MDLDVEYLAGRYEGALDVVRALWEDWWLEALRYMSAVCGE